LRFRIRKHGPSLPRARRRLSRRSHRSKDPQQTRRRHIHEGVRRQRPHAVDARTRSRQHHPERSGGVARRRALRSYAVGVGRVPSQLPVYNPSTSPRGVLCVSLLRTIGRWSFTALIVNTIIGSGIFGIPSELNAIVGRASPIAMLLAGLGMSIMMACFAEVASQFTEPGGAYLYSRTAFGRFVGMQIGWFSWLAPMAASAATANLLAIYFAGFFPSASTGALRIALITTLLAILALANYVGVRTGTRLSSLF